jgi:hypothetical protein
MNVGMSLSLTHQVPPYSGAFLVHVPTRWTRVSSLWPDFQDSQADPPGYGDRLMRTMAEFVRAGELE